MELLASLEPIRSKDVVTSVLKRAGRYNTHLYPFGNPVSIERCHLPIVQSRRYWVTEKTDGVRVCIMFTEMDKQTPVAVLMDRVGTLYGLPVTCDAELFAGSVFDAELVGVDDGCFRIYVFDVALMEGEVVREKLRDRLELIADFVQNTTILNDRVTLHAKVMYPMNKLSEFEEHVQRHGHKADGYILTPDADPAPLPGTAWSVYKVKSVHTIDLLWVEGNLWYGSGEELLRIDALPLYTVRVEGDMAPYASSSNIVIEFGVFIQGEKELTLRPLCTRPDKTGPNNALCVMRTVDSIKDGITLADLRRAPPPPS